MSELLLEIFSEEIPSRLQDSAAKRMEERFKEEIRNWQLNYKTLKDSCILEYNFDDNDGITVRDSSGNQNNGFTISDYKPHFNLKTTEPEKVKFTEGEFDNVFTCSQLIGEPTKPIQIYSKNNLPSKFINNPYFHQLSSNHSRPSSAWFLATKAAINMNGYLNAIRYHINFANLNGPLTVRSVSSSLIELQSK